MKKGLRYIIREQLQLVFEAIDGGVLDKAMDGIEAQIGDNIKNLEDIKKATDQDIENKEKEVKSKKQLKGQLPTKNPDRQGLDREIPAREKEIADQKKQSEELSKAKADFEKAQKELINQKLKLAQQSKETGKPESTLPSISSPI